MKYTGTQKNGGYSEKKDHTQSEHDSSTTEKSSGGYTYLALFVNFAVEVVMNMTYLYIILTRSATLQ